MNYKENLLPSLTAFALLAAGSVSAQDVTLRVNVIQAENEPVYKGFEVFEFYVERASGGEIQIELFASSQLGAQGSLVLDIGQGQYDMSATSPGAMAALLPALGVLNAPYMFRDVDHMTATMESEVAQELFDSFTQQSNVVVLDGWYYGTRQLTTNILGTTPEELSSVRMRIYDAPIAYEFANALGTQPNVVAFSELYLALQTGTVDAQENPIPTIHARNFFEVQDHLVLTGHVIESALPLINADTWNRLTAEQQEILRIGLAAGGTVNDMLVTLGERDLIAELEASGMEVHTPADLTPFRTRAAEAYAEHADVWGADTVTRIQDVQ